MSISLDPELGDAVREAAAEAGMTLSEWLGRAAETKLQQDTDAVAPGRWVVLERGEGGLGPSA